MASPRDLSDKITSYLGQGISVGEARKKALSEFSKNDVGDFLRLYKPGDEAYSDILNRYNELSNQEIQAEQNRLKQQENINLEEARKKAEFEKSVQEETAKREQANLQKTLDEIFGKVEVAGTERINEQFIPARQKAIAEEAALGRLTSPVSIVPLSNIDKQKQLAMSQLFGNIASQKAAGQLDTSKTIENILAAERDAEKRNIQFLQDLGLRRQTLNESVNQQNLDRALKEKLGIMSSEDTRYAANRSKDRDILDYLETGAKLWSAGKPVRS